MSFFPAKDPAPGDARAADAIDLVVVPRSVDVGHFAVRRALPHDATIPPRVGKNAAAERRVPLQPRRKA